MYADATDESGWSVLMCAADNGHADIVELLLKHGADIEYHEENGLTALHRACYVGHVEAAKTLVKHGAPINVCENNERTP